MNWGYIVLAYISLFALGLGDNSRGPLFPEILKSFALTDTEGAVFYAISSFCGFLGSYLVRFLLKKFNRVPTLQMALLLMSLGLAGMGFAGSFYWLLFFSGLFGLSMGLLGVVQNILVTVGSIPSKRQRMLSGLHAFYGIASLLAPLLGAAIMNLANTSWRSVFWCVALVPSGLFIAAFFNKKEEPVRLYVKKLLPETKPGKGTDGAFAQFYLGTAFGLYVAAEILLSSRLALFVRREMNLDLTQSSYYLTAFFVCLLAGRGLFALVDFRWSLRRTLSFSLLLSAASLVLGLTLSPLFMVLSGFFMAPFYPLGMAYIHHHFEDRVDAAISSCMAMQSALMLGMHLGVGYLTDSFGISKALWLGPVILFLAFLILNSFESLFRKKI